MPSHSEVEAVCIKGVVAYNDAPSALVGLGSGGALVLSGARGVERIILKEQEVGRTVGFRLRPGVVSVGTYALIAGVGFLHEVKIISRDAIDDVVVEHAEEIANGRDPVGVPDSGHGGPAREGHVIDPYVRAAARTARPLRFECGADRRHAAERLKGHAG